jgi:hypothetical protein
VFIDFLIERFDKDYDWLAHPAETLPAAST